MRKPMRLPVIITNFKAYPSATGAGAVHLAQLHSRAALETHQSFVVCVQAVDIASVAATKVPVFAQHSDPDEPGAHTGAVTIEALQAAGAVGTLLNHAEHRLPWAVLGKTISRAKQLKFLTLVCAATPEEGAKIAAEFAPDFIAVEPPELIGGDVSVSKANPDCISEAVALIGKQVIVGAGVKNGDDVRIARERGASGVLLASGVTKASDPYSVLLDLAKGFL